MSPRVFKKPAVSTRTLRVQEPPPPVREAAAPVVPPEVLKKMEENLRQRLTAEFEERVARDRRAAQGAFEEERRRWLAEQEPSLVQLVLTLVAKICRTESAERAEVATAWVREGLQRLGGAGPRVVSVHPRDAEAVRALDDVRRPGVSVEENPDREPGDAVIDTPTTRFDARLATRLEEVERPLRALSEGGSGE